MKREHTLLAALTAGLGIAGCAGSAIAQVSPPPPPFVSYAAKVVCGTQTVDSDVVKGTYRTAINIHNPQFGITVTYYKKAVLAFAESAPLGRFSQFVVEKLAPDQALSVNCADVTALLKSSSIPVPAYFEGFLVVEVPAPNGQSSTPVLDVIGKYTSRGGTPAVINVVPVEGKFITQ